jgi:hypothetical protein
MKTIFVLILACLVVSVMQAKPDTKLTPAEVISKHLESIGPAEARARVQGTRIKGVSVVSVKLCGEGQVEGQALLASQGPASLINLKFETAEYPFELLRFDGKKFNASPFKPGSRTCLAPFFQDNAVIFKEGLAGGVLSESWSLLKIEERNPKLEYSGLKKIGGRELHALKYGPRKGSEMKIMLYFDPQTFQHVRTDYSQVLYASEQRRIGAVTGSGLPAANQTASNARIEAYEEFSDFKVEGGLNLPHTYKFHLSIQSELKPALVDWVLNLTEFAFNVPFDPAQ